MRLKRMDTPHTGCVQHDPLCLKPERFTERLARLAPAVGLDDESRPLFRVLCSPRSFGLRVSGVVAPSALKASCLQSLPQWTPDCSGWGRWLQNTIHPTNRQGIWPCTQRSLVLVGP